MAHTGSCLCGAISFRVEGDLAEPDACHCSKCRKWSGHYWASTDVLREDVAIDGDSQLVWYQSSEKVRRGFCRNCGCALFWDVEGRSRIAIAMGAFDKPTETSLAKHIFVPDKGDYYEIADGLPKFGQSSEEVL